MRGRPQPNDKDMGRPSKELLQMISRGKNRGTRKTGEKGVVKEESGGEKRVETNVDRSVGGGEGRLVSGVGGRITRSSDGGRGEEGKHPPLPCPH